MTEKKDSGERREHPAFNFFIRTGFLIKVLTAIGILAALWYFR